LDEVALVRHAPSMRRLVAAAVLVAACQSGTPPPTDRAAPAAKPGPNALAILTRHEADSLCNAFQRSGAAADSDDNRDYLVATYLGKQITSDTGRAWLVRFSRMGADKAARRAALTQAAKDAGLPDCPLIAMWAE
jgi:hypothetical protein